MLSRTIFAVILALFGQTERRSLSVGNTANELADGRWDWTISIRGEPNTLTDIRCVTYHLDRSMPNPVRVVCDPGSPGNRFGLNAQSWGGFQIPIDISFKDGDEMHMSYRLQLRRPSNPTSQNIGPDAEVSSFGSSILLPRVGRFAISQDGNLIATISFNGDLNIYSSTSGAIVRTTSASLLFQQATGSSESVTPEDIRFADDGSRVFVLFSEPPILNRPRIWNCLSWEVRTGKADPLGMNRLFNEMTSFRFDTGTLWAVFAPRSDGKVNSLVLSLPGFNLERRVPSPPSAVAFTLDNNRLAYADTNAGEIVMGNVSHYFAPKLWSIKWRAFPVTSLAFSRDREEIAVATGTKTVTVLAVGSTASKQLDFKEAVSKISFTPDDNGILALTSSGSLRLMRSMATQRVNVASKEAASEFKFSTDGSRLGILTSDHRLKVHSVKYTRKR